VSVSVSVSVSVKSGKWNALIAIPVPPPHSRCHPNPNSNPNPNPTLTPICTPHLTPHYLPQHISGETQINDVLAEAAGSKLMSGWYYGYPEAQNCVAKITGCDQEDAFCHDRYALQRLVRGPFYKNVVGPAEERRMVGVPANLRHAMISLPHAYAPRLDAAIHLRTQFPSFEQSVGSDDGDRWLKAVKFRDEWLNSTELDCGQQLFKIIADRLLEELPSIRGIARKAELKRRALVEKAQQGVDAALLASYHRRFPLIPMSVEEPERSLGSASASASARARDTGRDKRLVGVSLSRTVRDQWNKRRRLGLGIKVPPPAGAAASGTTGNSNINIMDKDKIGAEHRNALHKNPLSDEQEEHSVYSPGSAVGDSKIYVYIASDNEVVKEAMAAYLRNHGDIAVMRVKNVAEIAHAKNLDYLRSVGNNTGVLDLALDWYGLSLSNVIFAWRRDTNFISTYVHSAQRLSGNSEKSSHESGIGHGVGSRGLSLYFGKKGQPVWRYFH